MKSLAVLSILASLAFAQSDSVGQFFNSYLANTNYFSRHPPLPDVGSAFSPRSQLELPEFLHPVE
jgi:hypothetical protein